MVTRNDLVKEFYDAAGVDPTPELCLSLIREEANEVLEAAHALLKELADLQYVLVGAAVTGALVPGEELPEDIDELLRRVIPLYQSAGQEVVDVAFVRVHASNMSKLTDGKMVRDPETGKILKGPNYQAPDLSDLV